MISDFGFRISDYSERERCARTNPQSLIRNPQSRGLTLLELLIVIAILAVLLGAAIPVLSPANDSRRIREAARAVNTFIAGAKTRAKETGLLVGVAFKPLSQDTGRVEDNTVCLEMYYVEQQPAYSGFDDNARVILGSDESSDGSSNLKQILLGFVNYVGGQDNPQDSYPPGYDTDPIPTGVIRPGDLILVGDKLFRFTDTGEIDGGKFDLENGFYVTDYGDPLNSFFVEPVNLDASSLHYEYVSANINDTWTTVRIEDAGNAQTRGRFWTAPQRYKILRQPTKTSNEPLQLTKNMAIDLMASGFGNDLRLCNPYGWGDGQTRVGPNTPNDIVVMFSPEGVISEAYSTRAWDPAGSDASQERGLVTSNLFLLVGLRNNASPEPVDFSDPTIAGTEEFKQQAKQKINWLHGDARWVVVGAQTGAIATVENAYVDPSTYATEPLNGSPGDRNFDNEINRRQRLEIHAAREFAQQTSGMGGA